jgi:trans-2,3-dihydro-3-hydroxyanthranilate isomerase
VSDLTYHVVDVFTDRPFAGNPLAVVLGAESLFTAQLAALAREFNLSETAFPLFGASDADYVLRIFTPENELPFAGHPSVGTAWLLASLGLVAPGRVVQRCGAGLLPLTVAPDGGPVELTGGTPSAGPPLSAAPFLAALGLSLPDAGAAPPRQCSTGLPQVFVEVASDEAVRRAVPDFAALRGLSEGAGDTVVFAWDAASRTSHARVFASVVGFVEDPATGSAATGFGAWLAASGYVPGDAEMSYVVLQGAEVGRPSRLDGTVVTRGGVAVECRVSGHVVPVASGTIRVP